MINYTEQLMYGLKPVQRDDPQAGQSAYYYFDPRYGDDDARHVVDVPDGTSPNPNADAIQQYLYENDEYRYKNLYGDTPPPTQTAVSDYTVNTENLMGKPSSYFQDNNSAGWSSNTAGIGVNPNYGTTPVLQNQTPTPWSGNYIPQTQTPSPWQNNQTVTPWSGGYDLSKYPQINNNRIDYSLYGADFTKEFIDKMENDAEFQKILNEYIIPNEGGYNNDPDDTGGETNMGIAQKYHPNEDIKGMTRERANAIYYRDYYNWNGLNKLPYPIRGFVVDYGLPTNPQYALKTVHNVLGIPQDAKIIGPTTLGIFENYTDEDYNDFLEKYRAEMKNHFNEIAQRNPQKRKFLRGWLNRANKAHLAR